MPETQRTFPLKIIIQLLIVVVVIPLLPMLISGDWDWWESWTYAVTAILGFILSRALAARRHPDILAERARSMQMQDAKPWDKILSPLMAFGSVFILAVAGFDRLYSWTDPFSLPIELAALTVLLLGYVFGTWALMENRFFSVRFGHSSPLCSHWSSSSSELPRKMPHYKTNSPATGNMPRRQGIVCFQESGNRKNLITRLTQI